jgi:hypothetical protein
MFQRIWETCVLSGEPLHSRAGFHDQLGWHFEPKIARVSTASTPFTK